MKPLEIVSFGYWVRRQRLALDLTQAALARRVGCATVTIKKIEIDERRPSRMMAERLAECLEIPEVEREAFIHFSSGKAAPSGTPLQFEPKRELVTIPAYNLPSQPTHFIGREGDIAQVKALLAEHALVTLTGSGGVGKSRLSLRVAEDLVKVFPDGVWLIELTAITDSDLVVQTIAYTLGLREEANDSIQENLENHLRSRQMLLVLDNCEHLVEACAALVTGLLRRCPRLKLLASSRELLGVNGEMPFRVPSLDFPDPGAPAEVSAIQEYEAVQLFIERAQAALPGFEVTAQNSAAVARICQRLDGIPLAIELAAARLIVLAPEQLARRLDDCFRLLTGGSRTALPRHQTLWAAIDWSYQLLSEGESLLLRRLSIFAGGWSLEAAEKICKDDAFGGTSEGLRENMKVGFQPPSHSIHSSEVIDILSSLVNKSMVIADHKQGTETRFRLLETVHQYAQVKLTEAGELQELSRRHSRFFVQFAETGGHKMWSAERLEWTRRLNDDLDNLRAAIQWSYTGNRDVETGLRIAVAIGKEFIPTVGLYNEARQWLLGRLNPWDPSFDRRLHVRALNVLSWLDFMVSISKNDQHWLEESIRICRTIGSAANAELSWALNSLATTLIVLNEDWELETALRLMEESVAVARQLGPDDQSYLAEALGSLVDCYLRRRIKDYSEIRRLADENLQLRLQIGNRWSSGQALWTLADFAETQEDTGQARSYLERALALYQEAEDLWGIALTHRNLGRFFLHQGEYSTAIAYHQAYLREWNAMGSRGRVCDGLRRLGVDLAYLGSNAAAPQRDAILWQAVKSLGAAVKLSGKEHLFLTPSDQEDYKKALELLHAHLRLEAFDQAWKEGQVVRLDEAVSFSLAN